MKKFLLIFGLLFFIIGVGEIQAACKYTGKIQQCANELQSFYGREKIYDVPGASLRSITDFPCLQANPELRAFQIAMDENFKKTDEKVKVYLDDLSQYKDHYFGKDKKKDYYDALGDVQEKKDIFLQEYQASCQKSYEEAKECIENPSSGSPSLSSTTATEGIKGGNGDCYTLAQTKADVMYFAAVDILKLNMQQVSRDEKKEYRKKQREKYDEVLDMLMIYLSYVEKIWKKWPSVTKHPL